MKANKNNKKVTNRVANNNKRDDIAFALFMLMFSDNMPNEQAEYLAQYISRETKKMR